MNERDQVAAAVARGKQYCLEMQGHDGRWRDFSFLGRVSDDWMTGAVAVLLRSVGQDCLEDWMLKAASSLKCSERASGGWGWDVACSADCDSTALCLRAVTQGAKAFSEGKSLAFILRHQREDGGFGTYLPESLEQRRPAFSVSSPCVTANVLLHCGDALEPRRLTAALRYLSRRKGAQGVAGVWKGLWWDGWGHTTALVVEACAMRREIPPMSVVASEIPTGSFGDDSLYASGSPLVTASLLSVFVAGGNRFMDEVRRCALRLVEAQTDVGSWECPPMLRFIGAEDDKPWQNPARQQLSGSPSGVYATAYTCHALQSALRIDQAWLPGR